MAWRARQRSENRRAGGLKGRDRGWLPGSSQSNAIGIPNHLVNKVRERTTTLVTEDAAANIAGGPLTEPLPYTCDDGNVLIDTRCLVVNTNQLSGIGRYRSQFNVDADGIKQARYYLPVDPKGFISEKCTCKRPGCFICINNENNFNIPSSLTNSLIGALLTNEQFHLAIELHQLNKAEADAIYGTIENWNTSNVTNMQDAFKNYTTFNEDISNWITSNVTNMQGMFQNATSFDINISNWDTSKVINMSFMFSGATSFNQPIKAWNINSVTDTSYMFSGATSFNQPLNSSSSPFAKYFKNVTTVEGMFLNASAFNGDINGLNMIKVTNMQSMFKNAIKFNKPLSNWDTNNVTNMSFMFEGATAFDQDIHRWSVINVITIEGMFDGATDFNSNFPKYFPKCTNFKKAFKNAVKLGTLRENGERQVVSTIITDSTLNPTTTDMLKDVPWFNDGGDGPRLGPTPNPIVDLNKRELDILFSEPVEGMAVEEGGDHYSSHPSNHIIGKTYKAQAVDGTPGINTWQSTKNTNYHQTFPIYMNKECYFTFEYKSEMREMDVEFAVLFERYPYNHKNDELRDTLPTYRSKYFEIKRTVGDWTYGQIHIDIEDLEHLEAGKASIKDDGDYIKDGFNHCAIVPKDTATDNSFSLRNCRLYCDPKRHVTFEKFYVDGKSQSLYLMPQTTSKDMWWANTEIQSYSEKSDYFYIDNEDDELVINCKRLDSNESKDNGYEWKDGKINYVSARLVSVNTISLKPGHNTIINVILKPPYVSQRRDTRGARGNELMEMPALNNEWDQGAVEQHYVPDHPACWILPENHVEGRFQTHNQNGLIGWPHGSEIDIFEASAFLGGMKHTTTAFHYQGYGYHAFISHKHDIDYENKYVHIQMRINTNDSDKENTNIIISTSDDGTHPKNPKYYPANKYYNESGNPIPKADDKGGPTSGTVFDRTTDSYIVLPDGASSYMHRPVGWFSAPETRPEASLVDALYGTGPDDKQFRIIINLALAGKYTQYYFKSEAKKLWATEKKAKFEAEYGGDNWEGDLQYRIKEIRVSYEENSTTG